MTLDLLARRVAARFHRLADRLAEQRVGDGLALLVAHRLALLHGACDVVEDLLPPARPARPVPRRALPSRR